MTKRLYETNSHLREFVAAVTACEERDGRYYIELDETAFFPEGGGQSADTGILGGTRVVDVQEEGTRIYHIAEEPLVPGETVTGILDYEERFSRMQQHTGEHLVSGVVHRLYGYNNVGFHLGSQIVTMDFDGMLDEEDLRKVERLANEGVAADIPIAISYPDKVALEELEYRSKIEIEGQTRIVTIPGYDVCACCAPHVERTGEVGLIKLTGVQKYKKGVRVSMLCGFRALADYNEKAKSVSEISALLSVKPEETADAVARMKAEVFGLKGRVMELQKQLLSMKVEQIPAGKKNICLFEDELDADAMRQLVNELMEKCSGICAVFTGGDKDQYRYVIGSREEDCRIFAASLNEKFAGKGGGKPQMVQGSLQGSREEIEAMFVL